MMLGMNDRPEHLDLSRAAGADGYLLKSARNEEIIERVAAARHITQLRSSSRETEPVGAYAGDGTRIGTRHAGSPPWKLHCMQ
jgi:hypothetical protein